MPSDPTFSYPPLHHHTTTPLSPSSASAPLSAYLEKSLTRPYLHPDAWLSLEGVRHGPKSGPQGSWALHHLRRIEAGMRGEVLAVESTEELVGKFGEEVVGEALGRRAHHVPRNEEEVPEGMDYIGQEEQVEDIREKPKAKPAAADKPEHLMTKAEKKKARRAAEKAEMAAARERGEDVPSFKKRKRNANEDEDDGQSEAATSTAAADSNNHNANINDPSQYQSARSYSLSQKPLQEDLGDRDPAGVDREDAVKAPVVVEHDEQGEVVVPDSKKQKKKQKKESGTAYEETEEKEAKRAAKKAKREEGKMEKDADVSMVDVGDVDASGGLEVPPTRKEKRKKREEEGAVNGTPNGKTESGAAGKVNGTPATGEKKAKKKGKKAKEGEKTAVAAS